MNLYEVLRRPVITEKSSSLQAEGKYAFEVARGANKHQVKQVLEKEFKIKVSAVNIITVPSKERKVGRRVVFTQSWKKAIVTLQPGDKIEFFENV
jgi:large subunit ribosomal protein L23